MQQIMIISHNLIHLLLNLLIKLTLIILYTNVEALHGADTLANSSDKFGLGVFLGLFLFADRDALDDCSEQLLEGVLFGVGLEEGHYERIVDVFLLVLHLLALV